MAQTLPSFADHGLAMADAVVPATPAFSPLYQQIKILILRSLQSGEWKPGETIPSEMDLAVRFRVSQGTVRKAIDELAAENLSCDAKARALSWPPIPSTMLGIDF